MTRRRALPHQRPVVLPVMKALALLLRRGGSVRAEYVPELRSFVAHWIGPDATRYAVTAPELEDALTMLVQRIETADTDPPPANLERAAAWGSAIPKLRIVKTEWVGRDLVVTLEDGTVWRNVPLRDLNRCEVLEAALKANGDPIVSVRREHAQRLRIAWRERNKS